MTITPVIAITGANGYVGNVMAKALQPTARVIRFVRTPKNEDDVAWSFDTSSEQSAQILRDNGVTCLIHAAWDMNANSETTLKHTCIEGSTRLFEAARLAAVDNVIFISTISAFDTARSSYGQSKVCVERKCMEYGGLVLRLGLVYGRGDGGVFGNLRRAVKKSRLIPLIGNGKAPQYLLDEESLGTVIRRAVAGDFSTERLPITVANPKPIPFRDILRTLAGSENNTILLPLPWPLLYAGLRITECTKLKLRFRSDSVLSFVFQNKNPDFSGMQRHRIEVKSFEMAIASYSVG